jgi:glycosyltransferase involved in cell wall biosynthesis
MRVLMVMEEVRFGGAEVSFFTLCRALVSHCTVDLAIYEGSLENPSVRALCDSLGSTTANVHRSAVPLNPGTIGNLHPRLRRHAARVLSDLIREVRPHAIIVNLPTVERGQAVLDAAELVRPRPPVWGFLHSANRPSTIGAKLGRLRNLLVPRLLRRFDHLLTVSSSGAEEVARRYHLTTPEILRPPVAKPPRPASVIDRSAQRRPASLPDTLLLGIVGRVPADKGHDAALQVTARLRAAGHAVHLVVIGDGPVSAAFKRLTQRLQISGSVSFLGWRDDADELIPLLSAVLMPSKHEGMPLTALQAAAARVPVIAYAVDGLAELLPEGFKIPYGDEAALTQAVAGLMHGSNIWPSDALEQRAEAWSDPDRVAGRLLNSLRLALQADGGPGRFINAGSMT